MKMRRPHRIPLSARASTIVRELQRITGNGSFVFPSNRSRERCMSENTINGTSKNALYQGGDDGAWLPVSSLIHVK
jgi:hypothetical protein